MYSKEESKAMRLEFWDRFKTLSARRRARKKLPGNWILTRTGIKALNLRFHVDRKVALVGIDLETKNMDKRLELFEKLEYIRENGKSVSRIYMQVEGVDIYDRNTWQAAHQFMFDRMMTLESFYLEYRDYFKYG